MGLITGLHCTCKAFSLPDNVIKQLLLPGPSISHSGHTDEADISRGRSALEERCMKFPALYKICRGIFLKKHFFTGKPREVRSGETKSVLLWSADISAPLCMNYCFPKMTTPFLFLKWILPRHSYSSRFVLFSNFPSKRQNGKLRRSSAPFTVITSNRVEVCDDFREERWRFLWV